MRGIRKLSDLVTPFDWGITALAALPPLVILVQPTATQLIIALVIDSIAFALNQPLERRLFLRLNPEFRNFFDALPDDRIREMSQQQRVSLVESFMRYPLKRAGFIYFESLLKILPAAIYFTFVIDHSRSNLEQFLVFYAVELLFLAFFSTLVFLHSHDFLSRELERLHSTHDFTEVFSAIQPSGNTRDFDRYQIIALGYIVAFTLGLQVLVAIDQQESSALNMAVKMILIGLAGMALFIRTWHLERRFFVGGLKTLFENLKNLDGLLTDRGLALHTSPLLVQFEKSYNDLGRNLQKSRRELAALVISEGEKSRFLAVGEISALIAHDLSGPLHSAQFCAAEIGGITDPEKTHSYLQMLNANLFRAQELISSLRDRFRKSAPEDGSTLDEAHRKVIRLLEVQFHSRGFHRVRFSITPDAARQHVALSFRDLVHVLDNLYRNSVQNLLDHKVPDPEVRIEVAGYVENRVVIRLRDNGTGLDASRLEKLTEFGSDNGPAEYTGLGLRLTRRLLEMNGDRLYPVSTTDGAEFALELRLAVDRQQPLSHG